MKKMTAMQCKGFQPSIIPNPCPPKSSYSRSPVRHALYERPCFCCTGLMAWAFQWRDILYEMGNSSSVNIWLMEMQSVDS